MCVAVAAQTSAIGRERNARESEVPHYCSDVPRMAQCFHGRRRRCCLITWQITGRKSESPMYFLSLLLISNGIFEVTAAGGG